jgi:hypothetical protein
MSALRALHRIRLLSSSLSNRALPLRRGIAAMATTTDTKNYKFNHSMYVIGDAGRAGGEVTVGDAGLAKKRAVSR